MKMIMMRGLPASGKSTHAREVMKESGNFVRLNKDDLRKMLHIGKWTGDKEEITKGLEMEMAEWLLTEGENVIIDDTNLFGRDELKWSDLAKKYGANFSVVDCHTDVKECLQRDFLRNEQVGANVIWRMALRSGRYQCKSHKGYVLVDIDGTLADISHRKHHVEGEVKDWDAFFSEMLDDELREDVVDLVRKSKNDHYDLFLVSGRPNTYRELTLRWLKEKKVDEYFSGLIMREEFDKRPDTETKRDILNLFGAHNIAYVIDDRPSVIRMWKENGVEVIDVGTGVEF